MLASLPRVLHIKGDGAHSSQRLASIIQVVAAEMDAVRPGHEIVATRLADVLFIYALREYVETLPTEAGGWLRALEDRQLGTVMQQLHERITLPWTVAAMAKVASMSRSTFAARFQRVVGESPMTYLTRWRMHKAMELMAVSDRSTAAIAESVGYETDSAFGKTFKRYVGQTPGQYRRRLVTEK